MDDMYAASMAGPLQLDQIVQAGMCIGCGLCESIAGAGRVTFVATADGRERPLASAPLDSRTVETINAVCPGTRIESADPPRLAPGTRIAPVWGPIGKLVRGHAADPVLRHRGASGAVLSALAEFLLSSGRVELVVHVAASRPAPMRSARHLGFDRGDVLESCGSRHGPSAPLRDFLSVLDRTRPFALIGKPCDVGAVRNPARLDPRVEKLMPYAPSMICGGASELGKSQQVAKKRAVGVRLRRLRIGRLGERPVVENGPAPEPAALP
jgi:coenzyme F420 hydrogenase subunit beta